MIKYKDILKINFLYKIIYVIILIFIMTGCKLTKYVQDDEYLLNREKVFINNEKIDLSKLKQNLKQKPNVKILGFYKFYLGLYNLSGKNENNKINKWLRSIGESPVIFDSSTISISKLRMGQYLDSKGYFHHTIKDSVIYRKNKANLFYYIDSGEPTMVSEIYSRTYPEIDGKKINTVNNLLGIIKAKSNKTKIKVNKPLDFDNLDEERGRVSVLLRNNGYYNFSKNLIQYFVDTISTSSKYKAKIEKAIILTKSDSSVLTNYMISEIVLRYDYNQLNMLGVNDSIKSLDYKKGYKIYYNNVMKIKPSTIIENLKFKPGDIYNASAVAESYRLLQQLSIFKYINIVFKETPNKGKLLCEILLTPLKRQSYNVFIETTNTSGNIGVGGNLSYNHRNLFGGAENFTISVIGAVKKEHINESEFFSTKEVGVSLKFVSPKFWFPFLKLEDFRIKYRPKTSTKLSYSLEKTLYYDRKVISAKYAYKWKKNFQNTSYSLGIIDLNYVYMNNVDESFIKGLKNNYVKSAYTSHFISSTDFSIVYSDAKQNSLLNSNYFRVNLESSGNIFFLFSNILNNKKYKDEYESYYESFGVRYAQFVKADVEYRYVMNLNKWNSMVYRFFVGFGLPYGNMKVLPFEEAYYSGGANGIRAWKVRTLGPGSYNDNTNYPNSVGEFKLEANMEYRFRIFPPIEGALFVDAGNIWNINSYENRIGTKLTKNFYKQIAVGVGPGIRLDAKFFLIRFDFGIKLYDPTKKNSNKFVLFNNGKWMRNTVLNIAIGYPF